MMTMMMMIMLMMMMTMMMMMAMMVTALPWMSKGSNSLPDILTFSSCLLLRLTCKSSGLGKLTSLMRVKVKRNYKNSPIGSFDKNSWHSQRAVKQKVSGGLGVEHLFKMIHTLISLYRVSVWPRSNVQDCGSYITWAVKPSAFDVGIFPAALIYRLIVRPDFGQNFANSLCKTMQNNGNKWPMCPTLSNGRMSHPDRWMDQFSQEVPLKKCTLGLWIWTNFAHSDPDTASNLFLLQFDTLALNEKINPSAEDMSCLVNWKLWRHSKCCQSTPLNEVLKTADGLFAVFGRC